MNIDKEIPIPENHSTPRVKRPFSRMEVGDSVIFHEEKKRMQMYCHAYGAKFGKKFVSRKQPCGGVRIWRTE